MIDHSMQAWALAITSHNRKDAVVTRPLLYSFEFSLNGGRDFDFYANGNALPAIWRATEQ